MVLVRTLFVVRANIATFAAMYLLAGSHGSGISQPVRAEIAAFLDRYSDERLMEKESVIGGLATGSTSITRERELNTLDLHTKPATPSAAAMARQTSGFQLVKYATTAVTAVIANVTTP